MDYIIIKPLVIIKNLLICLFDAIKLFNCYVFVNLFIYLFIYLSIYLKSYL